MPCDSIRQPGESPQDRKERIGEALRKLNAELAAGRVRVVIGPTGAIAFQGWKTAERSRVTDVCAYRLLAQENSWELRQAVARAEHTAGRKVNASQVAGGVHSHDGGATWHDGH